MTPVFDADYAQSYDRLYGDKDYSGECDLLEQLFAEYAFGRPARLLDLGCGTGGHLLPLAERGYEVVGVDRSAAMLAHAERKASEKGLGNITLLQGDVASADAGADFDAVLLMFGVLGYQLENVDVLRTLRNARRHVTVGGLLIFDVWYGPAVLHQRPSSRVKVLETGEGTLIRYAAGALDILRHRCRVDYRIWTLPEEGGHQEALERHEVRYFFAMELAFLLETAGFSMERIADFENPSAEPTEESWNALVVARATR